MVVYVGKRSTKQKIILRSKHPRSSMKIASKVLGHGSPTDVAEVELVKTVGADPAARNFNDLPTARISIPRTVPRSSPADKSHKQDPRRRVEGTTPLLVSTHPVAAIQQRSAVQRITPMSKLEGKNPNGLRSRTTYKSG